MRATGVRCSYNGTLSNYVTASVPVSFPVNAAALIVTLRSFEVNEKLKKCGKTGGNKAETVIAVYC